MRKTIGMILGIIVLAAMPIGAEEDPGELIDRYLYPPEMVMEHRTRLDLSETVGRAIRDEVLEAQKDLMEIQWEFVGKTSQIEELLQANTVNESAVMDEVAFLLDLEQAIKERHVVMLIRVRNLLTAGQRQILDDLRGES